MSAGRRLGLLAALAAGVGALALLGSPALAVATGGLALLAPWLVRPLARLTWPPLTLAVLAGGAGWVFRGGRAEQALAAVLAYLLVQRRLARRSGDDDRVSVLLAGLMLVAAAGRVEHPAFLAPVVAWSLALPLALLPEPSAPDRVRRIGWWASFPVATLLLTGGYFTAIPRLPEPSSPVPSLTGFTPEVDLGALGTLLDDPTVVLRLTANPEPDEPIYLRGLALDAFDGRRWTNTTAPRPTVLQSPRTFPADAVAFAVQLEPSREGVLFTAGEVLYLGDLPGTVLRDEQGGWAARRDEAVAYRFVARRPLGPGASPGPREADPARWRILPPDLEPRIRTLASTVEPTEVDPDRLASAFTRYLADGYRYSRAPVTASEDQALSRFLFDEKEGHCEYFASALAVLLRARGVPARVVNGLAGGERDPLTGQLVFRRYHAHSWVEIHTARGWTLVDATPGPAASLPAGPRWPDAWRSALERLWNEVVGWNQHRQIAAAMAAGQGVERVLHLPPDPRGTPRAGLITLLAAALLAAMVTRIALAHLSRRFAGELRRSPRGAVARHHVRARRLLDAQGWRAPPSLPPVEAARWLGHRGCPVAADLEELAWLFYRVRYEQLRDEDAEAPARAVAERIAGGLALEGPRRRR